MHYADINAALHKAGIKPAALAKRLRIPRSTVSQVIHGKATSRRVARAISRATGFPLSQLWPTRYGERNAA